MRKVLIAGAAAATLVGGCSTMGGYGSPWYPDTVYRDDPVYQERVLGPNDNIYVGQDGRYYCRRPDGTSGLIVGGIAGGVLGTIIAPGGSKTLGTILGGAAGAAIGRQIDRNNVRCR